MPPLPLLLNPMSVLVESSRHTVGLKAEDVAAIAIVVVAGKLNCHRSAGSALLHFPFAARVADRFQEGDCPTLIAMPGGSPDCKES